MHCYIDKPLSRATSVLAPHGWLRSIDSGINFCKSSRRLRRQVHLANQHHCCSVGGCPPLILPLSGFSSATCTSGDQFIRLPSSSISREGSLVSMGRFSIRGRRSPPHTIAFIYAPLPCLIIPFLTTMLFCSLVSLVSSLHLYSTLVSASGFNVSRYGHLSSVSNIGLHDAQNTVVSLVPPLHMLSMTLVHAVHCQHHYRRSG